MGIKAKDFFSYPVNMENLVSISVDDKIVSPSDEVTLTTAEHSCHICSIVALECEMSNINGEWYCPECEQKKRRMRPANFDPQKIVDTCQGTCDETLQSALDYHYPDMREDELTNDDHNFIANQIFLCDECGWWCEVGIDDEDVVCGECVENNRDY